MRVSYELDVPFRSVRHFAASRTSELVCAAAIPFAHLLGWATIVVEILGGLLILLGAFVPLTAVRMAIVLLVAIFTVHLPNGFGSINRSPVLGAPRRTLYPRCRTAFIGSLPARAPAMTRNALSSIAKCTLQTTPYQQDD